MRRVESPGDPAVSKTATPDVDGVQLHQTLGPSYIPVGSPASFVAKYVFDATLPLAPRSNSNVDVSKLSFVGPGRDQVRVNAPDEYSSTAIQYVVPGVGTNVAPEGPAATRVSADTEAPV